MAFRVIHIGIGGRGRHWLEFIKGLADVESVACVDLDQNALDEVRADTGCETFTDLDQAFAETKADGVVIASPSLLHGRLALQALEAGYGVMVEKPLAASLEEAVSVVEFARSVKRPLMVAENYRFFRAERTLRKALDEGMVGRVQSAVCVDRRNQPSDTQGAWVKSMAQPFLTEIAVHHFDSFRYLFDRRPVSVWAESFNSAGSDYEQNGAADVLIEMEDGLRVQYSGSFIGSRYEYNLWIYGERGELRTDRSRVWHRSAGERGYREVPAVAMPEGEPLRYPHAGMVAMLNQFQAAISGDDIPETSGADNLWTLAMFDAAVESVETERYVSIDDVLRSELRTRAGITEGSS